MLLAAMAAYSNLENRKGQMPLSIGPDLARCGEPRSSILIVPELPLGAFVAFLRLDAKRCDWPCIQSADADWLRSFFAIPV